MPISLDRRWQLFMEEQVENGCYRTEAEVIDAGLRLVEEREARLAELRQSIQDAIESDEWYTLDEVEAHLNETFERLRTEGL